MKGKKSSKLETKLPLVVNEQTLRPLTNTDSNLDSEEQPILVEDLLNEGELPNTDLPEDLDGLNDQAYSEPTDETDQNLSESRDLVVYNTLNAYLREIRKFPRLSREEETQLAQDFYQNKNIDSAYKLISSNLWLVVKIARDYERAARQILDLIQEGSIGLMEAVKNFDPYRGVRFPSYAVWWIKAYIVRYLINNWRLVKIGTTQAQRKLFFNLNREREKLEREGFWPGPKLLAEKLNVKERDVIEMEQRLGSQDMSVDAPVDSDQENSLHSILPDQSESVEEIYSKRQLQQLLNQALDDFYLTLKPKEQEIFKERLRGEEKATLQDLSEKLGVSRERIRQLENRIKEKLKVYLVEKLGSAVENIEFE